MTLGEKLAQLRKEHQYTQEQLAERLEVSRQAVSKWESDISYPETEKLIKLAKLYDCSLDYLLKDEAEPCQSSEKNTIHIQLSSLCYERKSKRTLGGIPLWHINIGAGRTAKGIVAVGLKACGVLSVGLLSCGFVSIGILPVGILALGACALGVLSFGSIALGVLAFGAIAVGIIAVGALSVGLFSVGALAIGAYFAAGDAARGDVAIGITEATGSLFQTLHALTDVDRGVIRAALDQSVPWIWSWAKQIILFFL